MKLGGGLVRIIQQMAKLIKVNKHIATKEQRRAAFLKVAEQSTAIEGVIIKPKSKSQAKRKSA